MSKSKGKMKRLKESIKEIREEKVEEKKIDELCEVLNEEVTSENFGELLLMSAEQALEHTQGKRKLKETKVELKNKSAKVKE